MENTDGLTKRTFLKSIGAGLPTLKLLSTEPAPAAEPGQPASTATPTAGKFTPIACEPYFTGSPADFGPHERAKRFHPDSEKDGLLRTPSGAQVFRGIPFKLGPEGVSNKTWILLTGEERPGTQARVEIAVNGNASYVCLAQFCDWDENEWQPEGLDAFEKVGQHLADAVLILENGSEHIFPIRRRFETASPSWPWGHQCFTAVTKNQFAASKLNDPLPVGTMWGTQQTLLTSDSSKFKSSATVWVTALQNPSPDQKIKAIRFESRSENLLAVCGLTLFHGKENPLRYERLQLYRIALPPGAAADPNEWEASVDLGVVVRMYALPAFDASQWVAAETAGLGERNSPDKSSRHLYIEATASPDATLSLTRKSNGQRYSFDLGRVAPDAEVEAQPSGARVRVMEREKTWVRGRIVDKSTGRPTPVRLCIRSSEGRYIPPYGHRTEINSAWFQDYGADLKWSDSSFAYVDGTFQVELPVGEVYIEVSKGFEYQPLRQKLAIAPGQKEISLEIARFADLRSKNWVCADSHVHFLSPSTAVLEGQAEGVNLVNLLAAQWGDLFSNIGDLAYGPLSSADKETLVWVGTENRQHVLGHIGLLGGRGEPVFPMSADGPDEGYIGTPMWNTLSDWADRAREREGLAVAVHFPYPTAELAADIVLGKIDAVELWPTAMPEQFNTLRFLDWYRYLNCGYRLPAVAGTDKMGAWIPVGAHRAYAYLGQDEFNFPNWAKAVRKGNTFMSSGPLLFFEADGRVPGDEIQLGAGGGAVEVRAEARSTVPIHRLEIVMNGRVIASREEKSGSREMILKESVRVPGPAWLAARCVSRHQSAGMRVAAHTSPVYVTRAGQELFSPTSAAYMMTLIDGSEAYVRNLGIRPGEEQFARIVKVFADARERLHKRMHAHGLKH